MAKKKIPYSEAVKPNAHTILGESQPTTKKWVEY